MKLLADENQHPVVVARLRAAGHEPEWVRESSPGKKDPDILARSDIGALVLITDDRDFGDLIFNRAYPAPACILYNRQNRADPNLVADRLLALLAGDDLKGHMITITKDGVRSRPFPIGANNG